MFQEIKNIGKHMFVYGLGGLLPKAIGFLLLPFYTHYIMPAEYGVMALIDLTGYVVGIILTGQISIGLLRYYYDCPTEEERRKLITTSYFIIITTGSAILGLLQFYSPELSKIIIGDSQYTLLFRLLFVGLLAGALQDIFMAYLRAQEKSPLYVVFQFSNLLCCIVLNIYFIAFLNLSILGIFLSNAIVNSCFAISCSIWLLKRSGLSISTHYLKELVLFGLPMIPSTLFLYSLHYADRYFLKLYSTMALVGIYSVAYKIGSIVGLLVNTPFRTMWSAKLFQLAQEESGKDIQRRVLTYLLFLICFVALCLCVPIKEIVFLFTSAKYHDSYKLVPIIALGYLFLGVNWIFRGGLLIKKKTGLDAMVAGASALFNLLLNAVLIYYFGVWGAAWATMLSYFFYSALMFIVSHRYYPISYEFTRLTKILFATSVVYAVSTLIPDMDLFYSLFVKALLIACFPLFLYFLGFFDAGEKNKFYQAIKAVR